MKNRGWLGLVLDGIASEWCSWTHGGGQIMRDPSGRVNWQCNRCGRWSQPVSESDEAAMIDREVAEAMREVGRRIGH